MSENYPRVEQPILVGFGIERLPEVVDLLLEGKHSAAVVRAEQYKDFEDDVLLRIMGCTGLEIIEEREFDRKPVSSGFNGMRELVHLDTSDSTARDQKVFFPYTMSISQTKTGSGLLVAASGSGRVRGYRGKQYDIDKDKLNRDEAIKRLWTIESKPGYNVVKEIKHKGLRSGLGLVHLAQGDVAIFPQGGQGSSTPTWHSIITPRGQARDSYTHHLAPS